MVKFYLDLNLSGASTAAPGVPSIDVDTELTSLPVIASTTCDVSMIKKLITFTTNNDASYNWADTTLNPDFSDFTFTATTNQTDISNAQNSVFSASDNWLDKFYALEHNQYADGASSSELQTDGSYNHTKGNVLHNGVAIDTLPKTNATLPENQASASRFLANKIAEAVFGAKLSYDIFDNEKDMFEQCTKALENMASKIVDGFINGAAGSGHEDSLQNDAGNPINTLNRATYVGRELIGRILAGHHGDASDNTTGGAPTRFSTIGDTTSATEIPLEAEDEIYVKCSGLTVEYDNPLDATTTKESVTTGPSDTPTTEFLVLLKLKNAGDL